MYLSMIRRALLGAVLLAPLSAQSASYSSFGQGCRNDIVLSARTLPRIGQSFVVEYRGPYDPAWMGSRTYRFQPYLITGLSNTRTGGLNLPFALPPAITGGRSNCLLYVSLDATALLPVVPGQPPVRTLTVAIPASPALLGTIFYQQWLLLTTIFDRTTGTQTVQVATSNAARGVVGM